MVLMLSCINGDLSSMVLLAFLCLVGLVIAFSGYRLYTFCLPILGFLTFVMLEGLNAYAWISHDEGVPGGWHGFLSHEDVALEKKIIAAVSCLVWGSVGAWLCRRFAQELNAVLGFILGAALGVCLLFGLIYVVTDEINKLLADYDAYESYQGWELFVFITLCLPASTVMGYFLRDSLWRAIMLTSAAGGVGVAAQSLLSMLACSDVELHAISNPVMQIAVMGALSAIAFSIQWYSRPTCLSAPRKTTQKRQRPDAGEEAGRAVGAQV